MNETDNTRDLNQNPAQPLPPYYCPEDEVDFVELVSVLARRRWTVFLTVFFVSASALLYCLVATPKYHIYAQLVPGITGYDDHGEPVRALTPRDVQGWFQKQAYITPLSGLVQKDREQMPLIKASGMRGGRVVTVDFYWPDPEQGKKILSSLLDYLSNAGAKSLGMSLAVSQRQIQQTIEDLEKQKKELDLRKDEINDEISEKKNQIMLLKRDISLIEEETRQLEKVLAKIKIQVKTIDKNTNSLIALRNSLLNASSPDKLSLLMYANIIQQNIGYEANLQQRSLQLAQRKSQLDQEKVSREKQIKDVQFGIKRLIAERDEKLPLKKISLDQQIKTLKIRLKSLSPVEVVQPPYSSVKPEKPAKKMIIAVAFISSWLLGIIIAFMLEFWSKNREQIL